MWIDCLIDQSLLHLKFTFYLGATSNVGLMAAKAEEYGSHDKTFVIPEDSVCRDAERGGGKVIDPVEVAQRS